jgi:hypothetical protein
MIKNSTELLKFLKTDKEFQKFIIDVEIYNAIEVFCKFLYYNIDYVPHISNDKSKYYNYKSTVLIECEYILSPFPENDEVDDIESYKILTEIEFNDVIDEAIKDLQSNKIYR